MRILSISIVFLLAGCASHIPVEIRDDITEGSATINSVQSDFEAYEGRQVRWGGTIAAVENRENDTWIEVVARELNSWGEPLYSDVSSGRFLFRVDGFLDPAIYKVDREITVYGTIESRVVREIDDHPYNYVLVRAQSHYLWNDYEQRRYAWPYYYPYYPYYYPYHYGFYFGHPFSYHPSYHFGFHHHWHHW